MVQEDGSVHNWLVLSIIATDEQKNTSYTISKKNQNKLALDLNMLIMSNYTRL